MLARAAQRIAETLENQMSQSPLYNIPPLEGYNGISSHPRSPVRTADPWTQKHPEHNDIHPI